MAEDIIGKKYAHLLVIEKTFLQDKRGNFLYKCQCDCGEVIFANSTQLKVGDIHSCGCIRKDIAGKTYNYLTAIKPVKGKRKNNRVVWQWQCVCGKIIEAPLSTVVYGHKKSCGCESVKTKIRKAKKITPLLKRYKKTCISIIESKKVSKNNTTGVRGVCFDKRSKRYIAQISIQKKQIRLGSFESVELAKAAREKAENEYFTPMIDEYYENHPDKKPNKKKEKE